MSTSEAGAGRPDLHQLEVFLRVVEARTFAGAARMMDRTQPAISQAIARLEEIYGGDLFERRRGAPLRLTPIGEAILPSARTILDTIEQQMVRAVAAAQSRAGTLTLGIFPGLIAASPLRASIADFARTSPQVALRLAEALPDELHRRLNERTIDLMVVTLLPKLESKTLTQERLWEEKLALALPFGHHFADRDDLTWADVTALLMILKTSSIELVAYARFLNKPSAGDRRPSSRQRRRVAASGGRRRHRNSSARRTPPPGPAG